MKGNAMYPAPLNTEATLVLILGIGHLLEMIYHSPCLKDLLHRSLRDWLLCLRRPTIIASLAAVFLTLGYLGMSAHKFGLV